MPPIYYGSSPFALKRGSQALNLYYGSTLISGGTPLVPDSYVTAYANYATGLAAVSEGQYFAAPIDTYRAGIWQKVSSVGNMVGVQPIDTGLSLVRPAVSAVGSLPNSPLVDVDSIDGLWGYSEINNRAATSLDTAVDILFGWNGTARHVDMTGLVSTHQVADSLGGTSAFRATHAISAAADSRALFSQNIPPGRWTFQFDAYVTGGGADQSWRIGGNDVTGSTAITVTAVKQTFSTTFTLSAETFRSVAIIQGSYPSVAASAGDITIENVRIVAGAAQAGSAGNYIHAGYFKRNAKPIYTGVMWSGGSVENVLSSHMRSVSSLTDYTVAISGAIDSTATNGVVIAGLNAGAGPVSHVAVVDTGSNGQVFDMLAGNAGASTTKQIKVADSGQHVYVLRFAASVASLFVDGVLVESDGLTAAINSIKSLTLLGSAQTPTLARYMLAGQIGGVSVWPTALSDADIATVTAKLKLRATAKSIAMAVPKYIVYFEGDSITYGSGDSLLGGLASRGHSLLTVPHGLYRNDAIAGATLRGANGSNSLQGRQASTIANIQRFVAAGITPIVPVLIGANDSAMYTQAAAESYFADLNTYLAALKAEGAKVVIGTILPINNANTGFDRDPITISGGSFDGQSFNGLRNYIRAMILANSAAYDGIADYCGTAEFASYNATYYNDVVHPNNLGHSILAPVMTSAVQSIANLIP